MKTYILSCLILLVRFVWATDTSSLQPKPNSNHLSKTEPAEPVQLLETPMPQNFFDDFESYTVGTPLTVQNAIDWRTWSGATGTVEDPFVTNNQSYSGSNSVVIIQNNDLVQPFGTLIIGTWQIDLQIYIPSGKSGYYSTLATFSPPSTFNQGLEAYFDVGGGGRLYGGSTTPISFSYAYNTWQPLSVRVDLDNDMAEFWFNGAMIHSWQWTLGANGGGSPLQLDASNLLGATADDQMYFDDYSVRSCTPGFLGDINNDGVANSTDALIALSYDAGFTIPQTFLDRINLGFADANDDGLTNSTDALLLLSFDAGIPVPFPVGDPVCL